MIGLRTVAAAALSLVMLAGTASALKAQPRDPASIAGVYKTQFKNGLVSGETYTSENILEIVRLSPNAAYVRAHLEFYNGHLCAIHGVARDEGPELVYRTPSLSEPGAKPCTLRLAIKGKALSLADNGSCSDFCGARGGFDGVTFSTASRRPIRYMTRLKASREFKDAVAQWR